MARLLEPLLKRAQWIGGVGISVLVGATLYPETLGLSSYRNVVAQYVDDQEQPLDESTRNLAEDVLIATNLSEEEEASIDFFTVYGQELKHRGSCKLRTGAIIGIPATLAYTDTAQVQKEKIQLNNKQINWDSRPGELLLQSIVLSEKGKRFAIAREIQYANGYNVTAEALLRASFAILAYSGGFILNQLFQLRRVMKRWGRGSVFGVIGGTFWLLFLVIDDTYYCWRDKKVDIKAAKMGPEYAQGGVEFYNKLLQRNMALRALMGSEGERLYTAYGNNIASWRRPHATLTERRDLLSAHLAEVTNKKMESK